MFDAQLLMTPAADFAIYGPWMQRGGDNAEIAIDVIAISLTGSAFTVTMETKAAEDAGDGSDVTGASIAVTAAGRASDTVTGNMKELVRYKFTFGASTAANDWVLFRMLPPSWYDTLDVPAP